METDSPMRRKHLAVLRLLLSVGLMGCGSPRELPPAEPSPLIHHGGTATPAFSARLGNILSLADVERETRLIDFADLGDASGLGRGWALEPSLGQAWGTGGGSSISFRVMPVRNLEIELRCAPFHFDGSSTQRVTVSVNGAEIDTVRLWRFMWSYKIRVPAEALEFGVNRLDFSYAYGAVPAEVLPDSEDRRNLSVLFETIRFSEQRAGGGDADEVTEPAAVDGGSRIRLPFSSRINYFLELGEESRLRIGGVEPWSDGRELRATTDWRLRLEAIADGDAEPTIVELAPDQLTGPIEMELPTRRTGQRARVSLAAFSTLPADSPPAGLTLDLPEVISQDDQLADLLAAREREAANRLPAPGEGPNIVVYMIDTLRADHLGAYGYERATSPSLDALAAEGTLFTNAIAQSPWTKPSVASVLTGLNPQIHGVNGRKDALSLEATTLAELLWEAGYYTGAIYTNGNLSHMGLGQGYKDYEHLREGTTRSIHVLSDQLNEHAFRWLERRDKNKPFFLYLHATDPHSPYTPPDGYLERLDLEVSDPDAGLIENVNKLKRGEVDEQQLADLVALYDAEILFNDEQFGRLVAELKRQGLYENTLILVVSDHGEEFFDHGWWQHGKTLFQEQLAVPLIVRFPNGEGSGESIEAIAQHIDIVPTILDVAGVETPEGLTGRSLRGLLGDAPAEDLVHAVSYLDMDNREAESVTSAIGKLVLHHYDIGQGELLFDLSVDPQESENLFEDRPVIAGYLQQALRAFDLAQEMRLTPDEGEFDPELEERLRALGYLD